MNEPFISNASPDSVQLYSGNPKDMIPFVAISHYEGKVIFQIPGGSRLEVSQKVAFQLVQRIIHIGYEAGEKLRAMELDASRGTSSLENTLSQYLEQSGMEEVEL